MFSVCDVLFVLSSVISVLSDVSGSELSGCSVGAVVESVVGSEVVPPVDSDAESDGVSLVVPVVLFVVSVGGVFVVSVDESVSGGGMISPDGGVSP